MRKGIHLWESGCRQVADPLDISFAKKDFCPENASDDGWRFAGTNGLSDRILVCGRCDSTFTVASRLAEKGRLAPWDSVVASEQTAGCGQYGRTWISPSGNLYLTWRIPSDPFGMPPWGPLLPLMLGAAFADALLSEGIRVQIKWPNDLVCHDRKLGGMLIRSQSDGIWAGIGINMHLAPPDDVMRRDAALPATHLEREGLQCSPLALWARSQPVVKGILMKMLEKTSTFDLINDLTPRLWSLHRQVRVRTAGCPAFPAVVAGLAEDGGLHLESGGELITVYSASIGPL